MTTPYHARFFAHELTRQGGDGVDRLSQSLFDACVDLNPHQIEAALFAMRSPVSKGVLLADEVGLGKTIEAGLVICQHWAERRRRILVICPASKQKLKAEIEELTRYIQWAQSVGVDTKTRALLKALEIGFSEMERIGAPRMILSNCTK